MEEISATAGDQAVARYGMHLDKPRQLALYRRYRDAAMASLLAYEFLTRPRPVVDFSDN